MLHVTVKLKPPCTMVKVIESIGTLSLFTAEKKFSGARGKSGNNFFLPPVICYYTLSSLQDYKYNLCTGKVIPLPARCGPEGG